MTKRELNKLRAGMLTPALLAQFSPSQLAEIAQHCFEKWKKEQQLKQSIRTEYYNEFAYWDKERIRLKNDVYEAREYSGEHDLLRQIDALRKELRGLAEERERSRRLDEALSYHRFTQPYLLHLFGQYLPTGNALAAGLSHLN